MSDVLSVRSYFHVSTHGLKATAESNGLPEPLHWPDFKEVAEFSHHIFLLNYHSSISYWENANGEDFLTSGKIKTEYKTMF